MPYDKQSHVPAGASPPLVDIDRLRVEMHRRRERAARLEGALAALGRERAQAVADAFLADGLDPSRITLAEPEAVESEDGEWLVMELGVAAP